jgi:hypothetical protein
MDCRTFHKKLEDYLEDGLDFSGRFGMERHAQQCIGCGKTLADAQRLSGMARELVRVKAPLNFEDLVLNEIGKRKLNSRVARFWSHWIYSFEWPSWRNLTWSSCSLALLLLGGFYAYHRFFLDLPRQPIAAAASAPKAAAPAQAADNSAEVVGNSQLAAKTAAAAAVNPRPTKNRAPVRTADAFPDEVLGDQQEAEYLEYFPQGPNDPPVVIRWPLPAQTQSHGQPQYFIQNVSH